MNKKYDISVDCGNCAAKIEHIVQKLRGVEDATVSFLAQRMLVSFAKNADVEALEDAILKAARRVEPDFTMQVSE